MMAQAGFPLLAMAKFARAAEANERITPRNEATKKKFFIIEANKVIARRKRRGGNVAQAMRNPGGFTSGIFSGLNLCREV
jgi:hypothetical protein